MTVTHQHEPDRFQYDEDIEQETPIFNVPDILFHPLLHSVSGDIPPKSVGLCPARDARLQEVPDHIALIDGGVIPRMLQHVGPGTDNAHITFQNI